MMENPFKNIPYKTLAILILLITFFVGTLVSLFSNRFTHAGYLYTFIYTTGCAFFISILLGSFYRFIYGFPRTYFYVAFAVLVLTGTLLGTQTANVITHRKLYMGGPIILFSFVMSLVVSMVIVAHEHLKNSLGKKMTLLKEMELENEMLKRLELEARLKSLQAKLNPHFLFNMFNALAALVYDDPRRAEQNIVRLSDLYRRVLSMTEKDLVPLGEEIALVKDYLELEKQRLDEKLSYRIECPVEVMRRRVPGLLIEPFVENAIKHRGSTDELNIKIAITEVNRSITIGVTDDGPGFDVAAASYGYGLFGVQKRLQLLYGNAYRFDIISKPGKGTTVVIIIPTGNIRNGPENQSKASHDDKGDHS